MSAILNKVVPKSLAIKEEDYWIVFVSFLTQIFIAASFYASVLSFRIPVIVLAAAGLWFTTIKVRKGYGDSHAWTHLVLLLLIGFLMFWAFYALTN